MSGKASAPPVPRGKTTSPVDARSNPAQAANATPLQPPRRGGAPDEEVIRARAYALWETSGRPDGDGVEFWLRAEQELGNGR